MTIHSENTGNNWVAIEIWADTSHQMPYILMLVLRENGMFEVVDPKEDYKVVFSHESYQEARYWLNEDEFDPIGERYTRENNK
jgi:hypothetical protein